MERLTKKDGAGRSIIEVKKFDEAENWIISTMSDGITIKINCKAIDKLAEYEDFMENLGLENLEELEHIIGFPRFVDGYDKDGKEINKIEFVRYKDELESQIKDKKKLMETLLILNNRWWKLKESIFEFKDRDDTTDDDTAGLSFVIEKMHELEGDKLCER